MKKAIADILVEEGYIKGYVVEDRMIKVTLKYVGNKQKVISGTIENSSIVIDIPTSANDALSGIKFD